MKIFVFDRVENIVGKGENAGHRHFLLFPQYFREAFYPGALQFGTVWFKRQNFRFVQIESMYRQKIKVLKMKIFVFDRVENTVGKGENAGHQHFLLFPQYFREAIYPGALKVGTV